MSATEPVVDLKPRHEAIIDFMVLNPWVPLGEVALAFSCSPAWLSTLMRGDLFKARLAERQDIALHTGLTTTEDRLEALATRSLERLLDRIETEQDTSKLNKVAETALRATGYIKTQGTPAVHNQVVVLGSVTPDQLAQAREAARLRFQPPSLEAPLDVEVQAAEG